MYLTRLNTLEGYERYVTELGGNPIHLLREVGLTSAQLRQPNNYCAYTTVAEALEVAAEACGEPLFGLGLSTRQSQGIIRDLLLPITQQPTLGEALTMTNAYAYLQAGGVSVNHEVISDNCRVKFESRASSRLGLKQKLQLSIGTLNKLVINLLDLKEPTFSLYLRQAAPNRTGVDNKLADRVTFSAEFDGLEFPATWLSRSPRRDNNAVRVHFEEHIAALQEQYPDSLEDQVRTVIGSMLPSGECNVDNVARSLGMSTRNLQKKLHESELTFSKLLHEVRANIAKQYLSSTETTVTKLALHLGYADVAVFSRQFRSWTGMSPRDWQKQAAV